MIGRLLAAAVGLLFATAPAAPLADTTPDLSGILVPPSGSSFSPIPSGTSGVLIGGFDAQAYVDQGTSDATRRAEILATLHRDGFAGGYGRAWVDQGGGVVLLEIVMALRDGSAAKGYLGAARTDDAGATGYQGGFAVSGLGDSYTAKIVSDGYYVSGVAFTKGNDYFNIATVAQSGFQDSMTAAQAKAQYDAAPAFTIKPPAAPSGAYQAGYVLGTAFVILLILGTMVFVVVRLLITGRRALAVPTAAPAAPVLYSPDGYYYWDGAAWREVQRR